MTTRVTDGLRSGDLGRGARDSLDFRTGQLDRWTRLPGSTSRLMLAMGQHDSDFVDAYYGPPEWKKEADAAKMPLERIEAAATALRARVKDLPAGESEIERLRHEYLDRQLSALLARIRM